MCNTYSVCEFRAVFQPALNTHHPLPHRSLGSTTFNKFWACGKHWTIHSLCLPADFSNIGNVTGIQKTDSFSIHTWIKFTLFNVCLSHWQVIQTADPEVQHSILLFLFTPQHPVNEVEQSITFMLSTVCVGSICLCRLLRYTYISWF